MADAKRTTTKKPTARAAASSKRGRRTGSTRHGFLKRNGLVLAFSVLTLLSLLGHAATGTAHENQVRAEHGLAAQSVAEYVRGPQFQSTLFENWESEFLQMGLFVLLTVWLRQRGASESRKLDPEEETADPKVPLAEQPWPMRRGGLWKRLYEHSLSAALMLLFLLSGVAHLCASWRQHAEEQAMHDEPVTPLGTYATDPQFGSSRSRTGRVNSSR